MVPASTSLTFSESRIAVLLLEGSTPKEIADSVGISIHTVRTHIRHLHEKSNTHSMPALTHWCMHSLRSHILPAFSASRVGLNALMSY